MANSAPSCGGHESGQAARGRALDRFVRGKGRYIADVDVPGAAEVLFIRSPVAHAEILRIDTEDARAMPGVLAVLTAADLGGLGPQPPMWDLPGQRQSEERALADGRLRHVGEAYAAVIAVDRETAIAAAALVGIDHRPLPPVLTIEESAAAQTLLYADWPDNVVARSAWQSGDVDAALADAAIIVSERFTTQRVHAHSLEGRGVIARPEADGGLTLWVSTQAPHQVRAAVSESVGIPEHRLRIIVPDVGGAFGMKAFAYAEESFIAFLALRLGRPMRWIERRAEAYVASTHGRDEQIEMTAGFDAEGRILGLRSLIRLDKGARPYAGSIGTAWVSGATLTGGYRVPAIDIAAMGLMTNKTPTGAYRGFGQPEANLAMERLLDIAASRLGIAPPEIRRRNLVTPTELPYATPTGLLLDSGDFAAMMDATLDRFGYADARDRAEKTSGTHRRIGVGMACYTEMTNFGPSAMSSIIGVRSGGFDVCTLRMEPSGHVRLWSGITNMGQGIDMTLARICADVLTVPIEDVAVMLGDTDHPAYTAYGTGGSRGAGVAGGCVYLASGMLAERIRKWGAHLLGLAEDEVELVQGGIQAKGPGGPRLSMPALAAAAYRGADCPPGLEPGLEVRKSYDPASLAISYGTVAAEVTVDMMTGKLAIERLTIGHDCGVQINPEIVDGQIYGAAAQAIGATLFEEIAYDAAGNPLTLSMHDYLVPLAADLPPIDLLHLSTPAAFAPHGAKGVGESGIIAVPAAIMNAVQHALDPGVTLNRLPLRPERVFEAIQAAAGR